MQEEKRITFFDNQTFAQPADLWELSRYFETNTASSLEQLKLCFDQRRHFSDGGERLNEEEREGAISISGLALLLESLKNNKSLTKLHWESHDLLEDVDIDVIAEAL